MATLTSQQTYLFGRLPKNYDIRFEVEEEPQSVQEARKIIEAYETKRKQRNKEKDSKIKEIILAAQEAIYFKPAKDALQIVKQAEQEIKKLTAK